MSHSKSYEFLLKDISTLKRVGQKTKKLLKKKKIENLFDVLWHLPQSFVDRSNLININKMEVGKICTIRVQVKKYNIPRIRNLPNTVKCEDSTGQINIVFFNSREGYLKKILPLNEWVVISGKVNFYNKKYQITNPAYVVPSEKENFVKKIIPRYPLTEGITEKIYRNIIDQVLKKLPTLDEWHNSNILKIFDNKSWKDSILYLHGPKNKLNLQSNYFRRLVYDEILSSLIVLSQIRKKIKKIKKKAKDFEGKLHKKIIENFNFQLTKNQHEIIDEISNDLSSHSKMFRILQGDVGSGKTIVSLVAAANVIESGYQVAFMAPTEILVRQHYLLANKIFNKTNIKTNFLTGKSTYLERKKIINELKKKEINIVVAMEREAKPLINYWNLKKNTEKIFSDKKKRINLIVSGIGKKKAENATNHIAEKTSINSFFLNIGIAGHRDYKLGEIVLVSKVTDNKTKYNWYPSLLWETKIKTSPLVTIGFPKIRYKPNLLYDMEASGFFKSARNFVGPEKVQCIKIISDNKKSSILNISSQKIESWIKKKTIVIDKFVKEFLKIK